MSTISEAWDVRQRANEELVDTVIYVQESRSRLVKAQRELASINAELDLLLVTRDECLTAFENADKTWQSYELEEKGK